MSEDRYISLRRRERIFIRRRQWRVWWYPLTKADIPNIVKAVLNNIPNGSEETQEEQDNPHLDLEHVRVLSSRRKKAPPPTTQSPTPLTVGSAIPPVPPELIKKIEDGKFIEMADLVPSHLGFEEITRSKPRQQSVTNISEWLQAFAKKQHQRVPDLMRYQILMLEISNEYQNNCWLAYDRRFRQLAATQPSWKWSNTDSTLWSLAFTGRAKASCCKHCFSLFHHSSHCEFAPAYSSSHAQASARWRFICRQWNEHPAQRCTFPNCSYKHVCYNCAFDSSVRDIHHKAIFCPITPAQQPVPLQGPRPLFQWNRLWLMQH